MRRKTNERKPIYSKTRLQARGMMASVPGRVCAGAFKARERGQATIEYVLLVGMAALIGISFFTTFNKTIQSGIISFNAILEAELMTGSFREAADGWEN